MCRTNKRRQPRPCQTDFWSARRKARTWQRIANRGAGGPPGKASRSHAARVELPPDVEPIIAATVHRSFMAAASPQAGEATVSWESSNGALRGVAPGPFQVRPGEAAPAQALHPASPSIGPVASAAAPVEPGAQPRVLRGAVQINLTSGAVAPAVAPLSHDGPSDRAAWRPCAGSASCTSGNPARRAAAAVPVCGWPACHEQQARRRRARMGQIPLDHLRAGDRTTDRRIPHAFAIWTVFHHGRPRGLSDTVVCAARRRRTAGRALANPRHGSEQRCAVMEPSDTRYCRPSAAAALSEQR